MEITFPDSYTLNFSPLDISHSELKSWRSCHFKWFLKHVWRLRRKSTGENLAIGSMVHDTLAEYYDPTTEPQYRTDVLLLEIFNDVYKEKVADDFEDTDFKTYHKIRNILFNYFLFYQPDWELITTEEEFRVPIFLFDQLVGYIHGRIDALTRSDDKIWIVDHKTSKRFGFDHLSIDPQADLYALGGAKLFGDEFGGVWFNYIKTKPSKSRPNFVRIKVKRGPAELRFIEHQIACDMISISQSTPHLITPNFQKNCFWYCDYLTLCHCVRAGVSLANAVEPHYKIREHSPEDFAEGEE